MIANYEPFIPSGLITKGLFNFDEISPGFGNFRFSGPIIVSLSDGFNLFDVGAQCYVEQAFQNYYPAEIDWLPSTVKNIREIFLKISEFANIYFSEITDYDSNGINSVCNPYAVGIAGVSNINITFCERYDSNLGISGINTDDALGYPGSASDIFINANALVDLSFAADTDARFNLTHEILHSLGLSHPFDFYGMETFNFSRIQSAGFERLGFLIDSPDDLNKQYFTIMSYDDEHPGDYGITAYTPMILDVIALQEAYGEGKGTTGVGDDLIPVGTSGYRTYFDTGGVDTLDLSAYSFVGGSYVRMGVSVMDANHLVGVAMPVADAQAMVGGGRPANLRWFYGEFENAIGSDFGDLIEGTSLSNAILGGGGSDFLFGGEGADVLAGGADNDLLDGGPGADSLAGGAGDDRYLIDSTLDTLSEVSTAGRDTVETSLPSFLLGANLESLVYSGSQGFKGTGNALSNQITGGTRTDTLDGGSGNDTLDGAAGNDALLGGVGSDLLKGGIGTDSLTGGKGLDSLEGAAGRDFFVFAAGDSGQATSFDRVSDYAKGSAGDIIDYSTTLTRGGNASAATSTQASINQTTGIATFASGSGTTLSDALSDIAARFKAATDSAGEFAFFKVNKTGDFHLFISDGVAGVTANDVVVQLVGITSISGISLSGGNLTITG